MTYDSQYEDLLQVPHNKTPIWRYMGFSNFLWMIQNSKLHFHRGDDFSDPFEGTTPRAVKNIRDESLESSDIPDDVVHPSDLRREMRKQAFLNCWHKNKHESAAMWDLYGEYDKTIAIYTTVGSLKKSINMTDFPIAIGRVLYADYQKKWENLDADSRLAINALYGNSEGMHLFEPYFLKQKSYQHEQEIRAVIPAYGFNTEEEPWDELAWKEMSKDIALQRPADTGLDIEVDLSSLIKKVYVSPDSDPWFKETVAKAVEQEEDNIGDVQVHQSELTEDPLY